MSAKALRRLVIARTSAVRAGGERGSVSVFVVGITVMLIAMAGLVVDGGNAINARQTIADDAEQAARAGATAIDLNALRNNGVVIINQGQAQARARAYLQGLGYSDISFPTPGAAGTTFTVAASRSVPTQILSLVGRKTFPVDAVATARAATGIDQEVR